MLQTEIKNNKTINKKHRLCIIFCSLIVGLKVCFLMQKKETRTKREAYYYFYQQELQLHY